MTLEILARSKGWLLLFLSKILSEQEASELFCALEKPAAFCVKKFLRKSKSNFSLIMIKLSLDTPTSFLTIIAKLRFATPVLLPSFIYKCFNFQRQSQEVNKSPGSSAVKLIFSSISSQSLLIEGIRRFPAHNP